MKKKSYKRFLRNTIFCLLALFAMYMVLFSMQFGPYCPTEYWVRDLFILKSHQADKIKEQKIVIMAGSNGLYGFESPLIEKETGIKTINMSLHAGLSLGFILDRKKLRLKPGDMVVLPLEFECYSRTSVFNNVTNEAIISWDKDFYDDLPLWDKIKFISSCSPLRVATGVFQKYIRKSTRYKIDREEIIGKAEHVWAKEEKAEEGKIQYRLINRYGDIMGNKGTKHKRLKGQTYGGFSSGKWKISSYCKQALREFLDYCNKKNVRVFITWPCTLKSKSFNLKNKHVTANAEKIKKFVSSLGVPMLGSLGDYHFKIDYFFDSGYHVNYKGRRLRTERFLTHLLKYLKK